MLILFFSLVFLINFNQVREIPLKLAPHISEETMVFTKNSPQEWMVLGYRGITKKLSDVLIDDSGRVHMVVDEQYRGQKHVWFYLRYDKNGNKLFQKAIYSGEYITTLHSFLKARLLINPDNTILIFYPDTSFYTCWVKLDREGNIIERHQEKWWRAGVGEVCSAGQDSFHIVSFPVGFRTLFKQYDPQFGEIYLEVEPIIVPTYFYSNNFSVKEGVELTPPYGNIGVSKMLPLPDKRVFCFSQTKASNPDQGFGWFLDSNGKCYDGERFDLAKLDEVCFAKVAVDTVFSSVFKDVMFGPINWTGLAFFPDSTIGVALFKLNVIYLIKYDLNGKIVKEKADGKLKSVAEMDKGRSAVFINQTISEERLLKYKGEYDRTIFYWGFDDMGNFFLQIY